ARYSRGMVGVTDEFASYAAADRGFLRLEGVLSSRDEEPIAPAVASRPRQAVFLYAGGLEASYGVKLLLDAFQSSDLNGCELWLAGKGELSDEIRSIAERKPRIRFLGYLPPDRVNELLVSASFLINARPSTEWFTRFSFPSKLLQYMASGTPVISTRLPGIPAEYWQHLVPLDDESAGGVRSLVTQLIRSPYSEYERLGRGAREFVLAQKTEAVQGRKLSSFLQDLMVHT